LAIFCQKAAGCIIRPVKPKDAAECDDAQSCGIVVGHLNLRIWRFSGNLAGLQQKRPTLGGMAVYSLGRSGGLFNVRPDGDVESEGCSAGHDWTGTKPVAVSAVMESKPLLNCVSDCLNPSANYDASQSEWLSLPPVAVAQLWIVRPQTYHHYENNNSFTRYHCHTWWFPVL
jgi:hypothetical protein